MEKTYTDDELIAMSREEARGLALKHHKRRSALLYNKQAVDDLVGQMDALLNDSAAADPANAAIVARVQAVRDNAAAIVLRWVPGDYGTIEDYIYEDKAYARHRLGL